MTRRLSKRLRYLLVVPAIALVTVFFLVPVFPFSISSPASYGSAEISYSASVSYALLGCGLVSGASFTAFDSSNATLGTLPIPNGTEWQC